MTAHMYRAKGIKLRVLIDKLQETSSPQTLSAHGVPKSVALRAARHRSSRLHLSRWRRPAGCVAALLWIRRQGERLGLLWRALRPTDKDAREIICESVRRRLLRANQRQDAEDRAAHEIETSRYHNWIRRFDRLSREERKEIQAHVDKADLPIPLAVVIFDAFSARFAPTTVKHLRKQLLKRFDVALCFAADCSPEATALAKREMGSDPRFRLLSAPFSDADVALLQREYLLVAEGGVLLREHALYVFITTAQQSARCLVYSDEDHLSSNGERRWPYFKPAFSPELLRRTGYIGHCALLRGIAFDAGAILGEEGSEAVGRFIVNLAQQLGKDAVVHLPFVLYHDAKTPRPIPVVPDQGSSATADLPSVSIIIPTKDRLDLLEPCLASIEGLTLYPRDKLEIVVIDNGSIELNTLTYLDRAAQQGTIRLLRDWEDFNYARVNNLGARQSCGKVLVFLNTDTRIADPLWLQLLVNQAMQEDVAAVGAKLRYPNGTVQFGGTVIGIQGIAG